MVEVEKLNTLWTSFNSFTPLTVLCDARSGGLGGVLTKVSVRRTGRQRFEVQNVHLWALGSAGQAPSVRPAIKAAIKQFQPPPKVTLRVNAPLHYRKLFKPDARPDTPATIFAEMANLQLAPASTFAGGSWTQEQTTKTTQLVGHIKVTHDLAQKLLAFSGRRGIFYTLTQVMSRGEQVVWFDKSHEEDSATYHARCLKLAATRGLKYRSGGGKDLGCLLAPGETPPHQPQVVAVQGVPKGWEAGDVLNFLHSVAWKDCATIGRRSMGPGSMSWLVKGLPPDHSPSGSWQYVDADNDNLIIYISKPSPRPQKQVSRTFVQPPKRQFRQQSGKSAEETPVPEDAEMEGPQEADQDSQRHVREADDDLLRSFLACGWKVHDLGGTGDCGYRSLAGAIAHNNGQKLDETEVVREGARIRYQAVSYMRRRLSDFKQFLVPDQTIAPEDEAPDHDQLVQQFLTLRRPSHIRGFADHHLVSP